MKILLLGAGGQVGWELRRSLAGLGAVTACGRDQANLLDPRSLRDALESTRADLVVNAAAYTAVDRAESEPDDARRVNGDAVAEMAAHCKATGALLVHYSTDYVFDGSLDRPYTELDAPAPLSVYGRTKLEGEAAIAHSGCRHLVFRTSWVFGRHGGNFLKTMLRLGAEREELRVVADQVGAPTSARLIADATAMALVAAQNLADPWGVYHLTAAGETNWHGYAEHVIGRARLAGWPLRVRQVTPIPASAYPTPAARPANSRLDCAKFQRVFGCGLPDWRLDVSAVVDTLAAGKATT